MNAEEKTTRAPGEYPAERTRGERPSAAEEGRDDGQWVPVYVAVMIVTVLVIASLWFFSRAFSS